MPAPHWPCTSSSSALASWSCGGLRQQACRRSSCCRAIFLAAASDGLHRGCRRLCSEPSFAPSTWWPSRLLEAERRRHALSNASGAGGWRRRSTASTQQRAARDGRGCSTAAAGDAAGCTCQLALPVAAAAGPCAWPRPRTCRFVADARGQAAAAAKWAEGMRQCQFRCVSRAASAGPCAHNERGISR